MAAMNRITNAVPGEDREVIIMMCQLKSTNTILSSLDTTVADLNGHSWTPIQRVEVLTVDICIALSVQSNYLVHLNFRMTSADTMWLKKLRNPDNCLIPITKLAFLPMMNMSEISFKVCVVRMSIKFKMSSSSYLYRGCLKINLLLYLK